MKNQLWGMLGAVVMIGPLVASAQTYDYTGSGMSGTTSGYPFPYSPPFPSGLTLDGTITLSAPLAPNLVDAPVTPTYALFSLSGYSAGGPVTDAATTIASKTTAGSWTAAPEIEPSLAISGLVMLLGGVAILRGRRA
jgi:hypothetical protein